MRALACAGRRVLAPAAWRWARALLAAVAVAAKRGADRVVAERIAGLPDAVKQVSFRHVPRGGWRPLRPCAIAKADTALALQNNNKNKSAKSANLSSIRYFHTCAKTSKLKNKNTLLMGYFEIQK